MQSVTVSSLAEQYLYRWEKVAKEKVPIKRCYLMCCAMDSNRCDRHVKNKVYKKWNSIVIEDNNVTESFHENCITSETIPSVIVLLL